MRVLLTKERKWWLSTETEPPHNEVIRHTYLSLLQPISDMHLYLASVSILTRNSPSYVSKLLKYMRDAII
jgi:hypothetical protein